ncbi:polysaccharide deacetylase family protein [Microbacterium sp. A82]|uniref:polysaccharide deacetylase family protein n=1 Tax=unclassified Microbacterium TaxID=2609290 RepID=UPI003F40A311
MGTESSRSQRTERRARIRRNRRIWLISAIAVVVVLGVSLTVVLSSLRAPAEAEVSPATTSPAPTPEQTVLTPVEKLLADADDPLACVVSFTGDGIADDPLLQRQDALYAALPIPARDGMAFGGWYTTAEAAAAFQPEARINGSDAVVCEDQQIELFGSWMPAEQNAAAGTEVPILMYHQFTTRPEGEDGWLRGNYAYIGDFEAHMTHIASTGFYLPTWDELSAFIDGRLHLPQRSVIVTDDDADQTWFDLAVPIVAQQQVLATSFMVTAYRSDPAPSPYVLRRSHTHDMHQAGANGDGLMVNWTAAEIAADLNTSGDILGAREVIAYPYGHFNDTAKQGVADAGYEMARTIEPGKVVIGTDKYALPVVRIDYGMGLDSLISRIG